MRKGGPAGPVHAARVLTSPVAPALPTPTTPPPDTAPAVAGEAPGLRVTWLGLRGLPGVQGGIETHAEQLCPRLAALGCRVTVLARAPYQPAGAAWRGVRLRRLWAPRHKHLETVVHTLLGVLHAGLVDRPDVLHLQAIGPALWTPLARLLGLRVVLTHHGADHARQKWGPLARAVLRAGEKAGARWAHEIVGISSGIVENLARVHGRAATLIPNGVNAPGAAPDAQQLARFGLQAGRYVLLVGRLVPEKRHLDLIRAFVRARLPGWKLALVGAADHADAHAAQVLQAASRPPDVVCTGFQQGQALQALYAHAGVFVLPSSHEGQPIALLEALSHGLPVIASDIAPHVGLGAPGVALFPLGDIDALAQQLRQAAARPQTEALRDARRAWVLERHDWDASARATLEAYRRVCTLGGARAGQRRGGAGAALPDPPL
jgi:glycosyltransferase involved in cell wall biosynthesis